MERQFCNTHKSLTRPTPKKADDNLDWKLFFWSQDLRFLLIKYEKVCMPFCLAVLNWQLIQY